MKIRPLLAALVLATAVAACNEAPTEARTPSAPAFDGVFAGSGNLATTQDGGSFGPGALTEGAGGTNAPADSAGGVEFGGSFGPGH